MDLESFQENSECRFCQTQKPVNRQSKSYRPTCLAPLPAPRRLESGEDALHVRPRAAQEALEGLAGVGAAVVHAEGGGDECKKGGGGAKGAVST